MRILRRFCALAGVLTLLVVPAAVLAETRHSGTFDIYLRGIRAAQMVFSAIEEDGRYSASARMQSSGLIGWLRTVTYDASAQGRISGNRLIPSIYREERNDDGRIRTARMAYRGGVPQGRELTPARAPRPDDIDPATQGGTWDVMTTIFAIFRDMPRDQVCDLDERIFDGRRVARIRLGGAEVSGDTITCAAEYVRIAGFQDAEMAERKSFPFRLTYAPAGGDLWRVTRVDMETAYGSGRMVRR